MTQILTPQEVAARLKLSIFTVRKLLRDGKLKGFKITGGKEWRVTEEALESFVRQAQAESDQAGTP